MTQNQDDDFAGWYAALQPRVLRAVTIAAGDRDLAEEATAEAFARAFARWPAPASMDSPTAWLHTVAMNLVRSRWRRFRVERRMRHRVAADPQRYVDESGQDDSVWSAVAELPERARRMVAMRYILDLSEAEIADSMGVTRGTVASTLSRARQQLHVVLSRSTPVREERS
ncbi:sigma-70 family RNA polymerase sigma factor [Actinobacteria bacterium YIM 96077]|uniref:SigE family RNA polymerase sigma factor n=1 Tax=Phytoactinopolyspora halophila TaxID=1981511 RepID=A0A329QH63_9ACTN|nr:sigma-70 family RNA polymerase sigma factor [Phytoactinopolyspora halophila]AYY14648.1 sigma-70 family RNA polymerase sigma factor [Actinobacteria bacterium YIM 96077]RAW11640.1 SigE family RNA polymerase sigma factor [Phytoactinopolyspora halophila]